MSETRIGNYRFEVIPMAHFGSIFRSLDGAVDIEEVIGNIQQLIELGRHHLVIIFEDTFFLKNRSHKVIKPGDTFQTSCLWHFDPALNIPIQANIFTTDGEFRHPTVFAFRDDIKIAMVNNKDILNPKAIEQEHSIPDELSSAWERYVAFYDSLHHVDDFFPHTLSAVNVEYEHAVKRYGIAFDDSERAFLQHFRKKLFHFNDATTQDLGNKIVIFRSTVGKANTAFAFNGDLGDRSIMHRRLIEAKSSTPEGDLFNIEIY